MTAIVACGHSFDKFLSRRLLRNERNRHHATSHNLLKLLEAKHGNDEVNTFGPRKLESLRDGFIAKGNCRRYANDMTRLIIRIIKHGVSRELVAPDRIVALESLPPLRIGDARETDPTEPVSIRDVIATLPFLSVTVTAMVRIQLATAMRPGELFSMTPAMIDRSGNVWFYRPRRHKTAHHGKRKSVPILGDALAALQPYLFGDADDLCFVTHKGTPWNKDSYRRHVTRACGKAGVYWTPYQLRHASLQSVRDNVGAEAAQALAGHSRLSTTEIYAKASEAKAIEAAIAAPKLG